MSTPGSREDEKKPPSLRQCGVLVISAALWSLLIWGAVYLIARTILARVLSAVL